ncbi:hypothetical protein B4N84_21470 [Flavobacterium sp. IR1]|nr:hypothetical protein B4N84_21470 [Flavobacterium sp. IR1]
MKIRVFFDVQYGTRVKIIILSIILICAVYYLFRNYKTIDLQLKLLLVIGILGSIWMSYYEINKNENVTHLINNFELTSGKVKQYIIPNIKEGVASSGISPARDRVKYEYYVNDLKIENAYDESYFIAIPDKKPDLSILYLVIYEKTNPKNSFILLNYPITSPEDFERYKEMFKDKIPANAIKQD